MSNHVLVHFSPIKVESLLPLACSIFESQLYLKIRISKILLKPMIQLWSQVDTSLNKIKCGEIIVQQLGISVSPVYYKNTKALTAGAAVVITITRI